VICLTDCDYENLNLRRYWFTRAVELGGGGGEMCNAMKAADKFNFDLCIVVTSLPYKRRDTHCFNQICMVRVHCNMRPFHNENPNVSMC
jgi:hypothetical protein